jgi:hypothetical protein
LDTIVAFDTILAVLFISSMSGVSTKFPWAMFINKQAGNVTAHDVA